MKILKQRVSRWKWNWTTGRERSKKKNINLFYKTFDEFHENRIKREDAFANADSDSEDSIISDTLSNIAVKIRTLVTPDKEEKKENEEGKKPSLNDKKNKLF